MKYRVKATGEVGVHLANDSKGRMVLESNRIFVAWPNEVEEVKPWTYNVRWMGKSKIYTYHGPEGCVKVGDRLLHDNGGIAEVIEVNTQQDAQYDFLGVKLLTTEI